MAGCDARRILPLLVLILALAALAGCGSTSPEDLPPAAEPASAPAPAVPPAGRLVRVGFKPEGVVADPRTGLVAVGLRRPAALALVDGATGDVVRRVPLPAAPRHLALAAPGGPVLVPAEDADALLRVALPGGGLDRAPTGREPHDAAAAGGRVFVADELAHRLTVLQGDRIVARVQTALQPGGITPLDHGRQVAVVAVKERVVETYDAATGKRTGRVAAGVGPTHAVSDGGGYLWVADTDGGALLVYHLRPRLELIRRYPLPGSPYGLAIDNRRRRLFVTQTARNQLTELTAGGRPSLVRRHPTPQQPNTVAVDEATGRVFVTGKVDGVLQLLDPGRERSR
jgi:predicted small lipoprotein YifL